eukprot:gene23590-9810_t
MNSVLVVAIFLMKYIVTSETEASVKKEIEDVKKRYFQPDIDPFYHFMD